MNISSGPTYRPPFIWPNIFKELGFTHVDIQIQPITNGGNQNSELMARHLAQIDEKMRQHGMTYTLNIEAPNFREVAEVTPGVNEFDHPGGLHRWDLRMEWLRPLLPPAAASPEAFLGIVYDECEHMQLCSSKFANRRRADFDRPFLVNTHGMDLSTAYDQLVAACRQLREQHYEGRVPLRTEQVWPDLFHIFANGGWNITPKLMKEGFNSVVLSVALGAAIQYSDRTHFWVSPDFWRYGEFPGHSAEELRSALLMAYWVGAETIYIESFRALAVPVDRTRDEPLEITAAGQVAREFAKEYVPSHPRPITWRDYRPRVAFVRLPDGGWGQSPPDAVDDEYPSRNRLLGNREHPLDKAASEWLYVWPMLTHSVVRPGAITIWNKWVYPENEKRDSFVPVDSVAVFDHLVEGPVLDSVDCFIVCGHALSIKPKPSPNWSSDPAPLAATGHLDSLN